MSLGRRETGRIRLGSGDLWGAEWSGKGEMSKLTNQTYLQTDQYRDASNLGARLRLHQQYSTNPYGWARWVFGQLDLPERCRILELGCGPGYLWLENVDRISAGWEITLSDLSLGMVQEARENLRGSRRNFGFRAVDAQELPFADGSFDVVVANHMLYHMPKRERALSEIRRVLQPGGRLYAATNGKAHLRELRAWRRKFYPQDVDKGWEQAEENFGLETGREQLRRWFVEVRLKRYEDGLEVTEVEPVVAYVRSFIEEGAGEGADGAFRRFLEHELASSGAIRITKDPGMFEAVRAAGD
jgi:ubiquinone/menaquinone biosynthesis C-methylase UbiE